MNRRLALLLLASLAFSPAAFAGGKKENKSAVTFHMETDANENPKMIFQQLTNGKQRFFRRLPEITLKDVVSYNPFPSELDDGYGMVLRLTGNATNRLSAATVANQGKWLIAHVNGRIVDGVLIDKQINDGYIVIWKGVTIADVNLLDEDLPRIGQENVKKKKKKK